MGSLAALALCLPLFPCAPARAAKLQDPASGPDPAAAVQADALRLLRACDGALGGAAARERRGHLRLEGTCRIDGFQSEGRVVDRYAPDGRVLLSTAFEGLGTFSLGFDGCLVWERAPNLVELRHGWEADAARRRHAWSRLAPPLDAYAALRVVGEVERDGVPCWELELVPEGRPTPDHRPRADRLWLERATHLPRAVELDSRLTTGDVGRVSVIFEDWRDLAGAPFAHRRRIVVGGPALVFEYPTVHVDVEDSAGTYALDAEVCDAVRTRLASPGRPCFHLELRPAVVLRTASAVGSEPEDPALDGRTLGRLWGELRAVLEAEGSAVTGPPVFRRRLVDGRPQLVAGLPVARAPEGDAAPPSETLPAGWVLSGTHVGAPDRLAHTRSTLDTWYLGLPLPDGRTVEADGEPWNVLLTDPTDSRDPSTWRIEVVAPVRLP